LFFLSLGNGAGPALNFPPPVPAIMELTPSTSVVNKLVEVELDEIERNFLHVVEGTLGSDLGSGLFTKKD
jgi:hypothetical protein